MSERQCLVVVRILKLSCPVDQQTRDSLSYIHPSYQVYHKPDTVIKFSLVRTLLQHATNYNLRDNLKFDLTHTYWKGNNDSFTHRASIIWNSLPVKIKSLPSFASFKANLVKYSKSIDEISFGCSSTITFKNSDDFIYF